MNNTKANNSALNKILFDPIHEKVKLFHFTNTPLKEVIIVSTPSFANGTIENRLTTKFHILEYIIKGEGELHINGKIQKIKANRTIFIQKGTLHSIYSNKNTPIEKIWIAFSCTYLNSMITDFSIRNGIYFIDSFPEFKTLSLLTKNYADKSMVYTIVQNLHSILSNIASAVSHTITDKPLISIKTKLDSFLYSKCTLPIVAKELNISIPTIIRIFKKHYGVTPYKYLLDKKLSMAKEYLKTSNLSIKNIALMFAFSDEHYFTYLFTKKNGISPSDYRKQYDNSEPL